MGIFSKWAGASLGAHELKAKVMQLIASGLTDEDIARVFRAAPTDIAAYRKAFNASQPVGERRTAYGSKFGLPLIGAPLIRDDET